VMQFDKADLSIKVLPDDKAIDAVADQAAACSASLARIWRLMR